MPAPPTQWYLARDGQQYGPISEAELAKFIELGHLQPTDLLWREGFPDWRPAMVVFPLRTPAAPRPAMRPAGASQAPAGRQPGGRPQQAPARGRAERGRHDERRDGSRGGGLGRAVVVLVLIAGAVGGLYVAYANGARIMEFVISQTSTAPIAKLENVDEKSLQAPPLRGSSPTLEGVDENLQGTALWRVIKREFPEWYTERVKEVVGLAGENKDEMAIGQHLARALVALRRQNVDNALAASVPRLRQIASAFVENLVQLRSHNVETCYGYISQGDASPLVVSLLQGSQHTVHLQTQMTAVFEAIAEGRRAPRVYPRASENDYQLLKSELVKRGWSTGEIEHFFESREPFQDKPDKLCQMTHDLFVTQLSIRDADAQLRLLVSLLAPVVAG